MKKIYILLAAAALLLSACHQPEYVAPTAQRQGISSLAAYFAFGPFEGKEMGRLEITDAEQDYFVIPIPWYYPADSKNRTDLYMTRVRVQATLQPNCKISPHLGEMDLTQENKFTYTDATGESREITITGKRVKSSECRIYFLTVESPEVSGVVDEANHIIYLPTTEDLSSVKARYAITARTTIEPDPAKEQNYNDGVEFTVTSEDGDTKQVYTVKRESPSKTDYGFQSSTIERLFSLDPSTIGLPAFGEAVNVSMGVLGDWLIVNTATGAAPKYFNKVTGSKGGEIALGDAVPTGSIASDEAGHLLLCNYAAAAETFTIWKTSSVSKAPEAFITFDNDLDIPMGAEMKVIGDVDGDAVITITHDGVVGETVSGRFRSLKIVGGALVANEVCDILTANGLFWSPGPAGATCIASASTDMEQGWYTCIYPDAQLLWIKKDLSIGAQANGIGPDETENMYLNGNVDPNNLDSKNFNGATYLALFASNHFPKWWPGPQLYLYDVAGGAPTGNVWDASQLVYSEPNTSMYDFQNNKGSNEGNGACGDVILAPTTDGYKLYLYYYDHFGALLGGLVMDCLRR